MNKKIILKKNTIFLFVANIVIFLLLILFKNIYNKINYWVVASNIMLIVNLFVLLIGIYFNFLFVIKDYKYKEDNKKIYITISIVFAALQLFNTAGLYIINKIHDSAYKEMNNVVSSYCEPEKYYCDSYEIIRNRNKNDFISYKTYYDYNNKKNEIEIHTVYSSDKVTSVKAVIYSRKDSFSEYLIREKVKDYFSYFNYEVNEEKIKEAFENRFKGKVSLDNCSYKVEEIYKKKQLHRLKTIIELKVD